MRAPAAPIHDHLAPGAVSVRASSSLCAIGWCKKKKEGLWQYGLLSCLGEVATSQGNTSKPQNISMTLALSKTVSAASKASFLGGSEVAQLWSGLRCVHRACHVSAKQQLGRPLLAGVIATCCLSKRIPVPAGQAGTEWQWPGPAERAELMRRSVRQSACSCWLAQEPRCTIVLVHKAVL